MRILFLPSLLLIISFSVQSQSNDLRSLDGATQTISPGEKQLFHLDIKKSEFAFLRFEQKGADIVIDVKDPEGNMLMQFDGDNGSQGPELVQIVPSKNGAYLLEVSAFEDQKKPGDYSIHIEKVVEKAANLSGRLDQLFAYWEDKQYLPGFGVAILSKDQILFQKGYGYSNLEKKLPYTTQTIQNIGSVSKTLIGISLMKAVADGKLSMDDPINKYLPYEVKNPYFPEKEITIRQLANHTSSIAEMDAYEQSYILKDPFKYEKGEIAKWEYKEMRFYEKNQQRSMGDFMEALFSTKGDLYKKKNFLKQAPGEKYSYSNAGATLAAYIIELIYEMPYHAFTKTYILDPLKMDASGWSYESIDADLHSNLHFQNGKVLPRYTLITYPDGGLLTNVEDLSKYLQNQMKGYLDGSGILAANAYRKMMAPSLKGAQIQRPNRNYGIFWELTGQQIGHNGGDPGIVCYLRFDPETGLGRIFMMNVIPNTPMKVAQFRVVWGLLGDYGEAMLKAAAKGN